jgi:L-alanine-DL-glutamate epimerase-like enolase superfamily enzyme
MEIALWDIVGKAAGAPIAKLLGSRRDRIPVYAATSRLLDTEAHVRQVQELASLGYKAVKLRLHRQNPLDDIAVVEAVREAVGDELLLLVDANQNNNSPGYEFWDRQTAMRVARELDRLRVYFMEEPLPRADIAGLAEIAAEVDMFVAGGEHTPTAYEFRDHLEHGAYDIVQPDVTLMGNMGIIGLRKVADMADASRRLIIPHVTGGGTFPFYLAATLHAMATVDNCPMVEYPCDPPVLTPETLQVPVAEPLTPDADGCVAVPDGPGLGIELDEELMAAGVVIDAVE